MEETALEHISRTLEESGSSRRELESGEHGGTGRRGIGLQNVHLRIRLMFGENYGIGIASRLNEGTKVIVTIPIPPERG